MAGKEKLPKELLAKMGRECLSNNINQAARIITRLYDERLRRQGYLATQIQTLYRIAYWEPVSVNDLAKKSDMDRTTAIRNCRVLEKEGLIAIREGDDRRFRMLELTAKGWRIVKKAYEVWLQRQAEVAEKLGPEDMARLVEMLRTAGKKLRPQ